MSCFLVLRTDERVIVMSDGATFMSQSDFTITGLANKVYILPHIKTVIVCRGTYRLFCYMWIGFADTWLSFDTVIEKITDNATVSYKEYCRIGGERTASAEIVISGWSESRNRFESYSLLMGDPETIGGIQIGLKPAPEFYAGPFPAAELIEKYKVGTISNYDGDLARFVQAQRETTWAMCGPDEDENAAPRGHTVGGFIQKTTLTMDGIFSEIVHRWNDKVGELIDPSKDVIAGILAIPEKDDVGDQLADEGSKSA